MKHRRIAIALVVLLCATALLSGTLLILYADHECHQTACPVCMVLTRGLENLLRTVSILAGMGLFGGICCLCCTLPAENRYIPDWTPVRRKVKLLN